jgi:hypothetical protein
MEIQGKLYKKFDSQEVGVNKFIKREFVIELGGDTPYPQLVKFELTKDNCNQLDAYQPGEIIEVSFDLKGREWKNKTGELVYFNTLNAFRLKPIGTTASTAKKAPEVNDFEPFNPEGSGHSQSDTEDLPF